MSASNYLSHGHLITDHQNVDTSRVHNFSYLIAKYAHADPEAQAVLNDSETLFCCLNFGRVTCWTHAACDPVDLATQHRHRLKMLQQVVLKSSENYALVPAHFNTS
jgi:hypothetical protein